MTVGVGSYFDVVVVVVVVAIVDAVEVADAAVDVPLGFPTAEDATESAAAA